MDRNEPLTRLTHVSQQILKIRSKNLNEKLTKFLVKTKITYIKHKLGAQNSIPLALYYEAH